MQFGVNPETCYNISAKTYGTRGGLFLSAVLQHNILLWAKRPPCADSRPAVRLSSDGKHMEGALFMSEEEKKQCYCCEEWKPKEQFARRNRKCRICANKRIKERYHQNPELFRERSRQYRLRNLEKKQRYYQRNSERFIKYKVERNKASWDQCITLAGEVCQKCGKRKLWQIMSFHHIDPRLKTKNGANAVRQFDLTELDKCALLCMECHMLYTAKVWQGTWRKRDGLGYELAEWWYTFRYSGENSEVSDIRFRGTK